MLSLNGVSAWIEVDGKELKQYGVEEDLRQSQIACWIATEADKCFSVVFRDDITYRGHSLTSSLQLDGSSVGGMVLRLPTRIGGDPNCTTNRTVVQKDQVISVTSSRPFIFAKLELTDEDEYLNQASTRLGEIRIHIYRVQPLEIHLFKPVSGVPGHGKVHERSKKAVTQCLIREGNEDGNIVSLPCLLQANGIIPKPPPAKKKAAVFEDVLDLTTGDDVKQEPDNITQKKTAVLLSKRPNSGRENEARPGKRTKREKEFVPTDEVIDLT